MKFVGNSPKLDVPQAPWQGITLGKPQGNQWYSVEEFESMGYIGIYMAEDITAEDARKFWNQVDFIADCKKNKRRSKFKPTLESSPLTEEVKEFTKLYILNNTEWKGK